MSPKTPSNQAVGCIYAVIGALAGFATIVLAYLVITFPTFRNLFIYCTVLPAISLTLGGLVLLPLGKLFKREFGGAVGVLIANGFYWIFMWGLGVIH